MMETEKYRFKSGDNLSDFVTDYDAGKKSDLKEELAAITEKIADLQDVLFAERRQALLVVFQGMDAAGKDSAIKAIFSGVNPQGVQVNGFKAPSKEEYSHDYLWRHYIRLPQKGKIGIFNRSHYENVLTCRVHPEYILSENLPIVNSVDDVNDDFFAQRYKQINDFENTQIGTGTQVIKFMLHVSQKQQHKRFLNRLEEAEDNWKFSKADFEESKLWPQYMDAYQKMLQNTSTDAAPWYVIPCDNKPTARVIMGNIILQKLVEMKPKYPELPDQVLKDNMEVLDELRNATKQ